MSTRKFWAPLVVVCLLVVSGARPALAWTQVSNGDSDTAACSPCYKIIANVPHYYRTGTTWPSAWDATLTNAFGGWNALRPPALNPVWSRTYATNESILLGRGPVGVTGAYAVTTFTTGTQNGQPVITYATITITNAMPVDLTYNTDVTRVYLPKTLAHEIGHGGEALSHSRVEGNLMVSGKTDRTAPGPDDYNGIRGIYG